MEQTVTQTRQNRGNEEPNREIGSQDRPIQEKTRGNSEDQQNESYQQLGKNRQAEWILAEPAVLESLHSQYQDMQQWCEKYRILEEGIVALRKCYNERVAQTEVLVSVERININTQRKGAGHTLKLIMEIRRSSTPAFGRTKPQEATSQRQCFP